MELPKAYSPNNIEEKWYDYWQDNNVFSPNDDTDTYTIMIPPPNVTGILHLGHVLNNTIQDILIRKAKMEGKNTLWVPGTDHASIATEAKVTAMLKKQGVDKKYSAAKNGGKRENGIWGIEDEKLFDLVGVEVVYVLVKKEKAKGNVRDNASRRA